MKRFNPYPADLFNVPWCAGTMLAASYFVLTVFFWVGLHRAAGNL